MPPDLRAAFGQNGVFGVDAVLKTDMQDVKTVGIQGTPTFFVNGQPLTEFGPEPLRQLVLSELAKARQ